MLWLPFTLTSAICTCSFAQTFVLADPLRYSRWTPTRVNGKRHSGKAPRLRHNNNQIIPTFASPTSHFHNHSTDNASRESVQHGVS